ncbi:peptidylprolyl isomerase [Candidatus Woesearchaeota archaeon]|nr:peptidylprolyl isomerase [Candidatus Woesearchaeota archaeon]
MEEKSHSHQVESHKEKQTKGREERHAKDSPETPAKDKVKKHELHYQPIHREEEHTGHEHAHRKGPIHHPHHARRHPLTYWNFFSVAIAVLIVIGLILVVVNFGAISGYVKGLISPGETAAVVNGETISLEELNTEYERLSPQVQSLLSKDFLLQSLIDQTLLLQQANKAAVTVDPAEVQGYIDEAKVQLGMSDEEFESWLFETQKLSLDEAREKAEQTLVINKFINENVLSGIEVSEQEIGAYYAANPDQFALPEQVSARHILIRISDEVPDAEAEATAEGILAQIGEGADFCEMVTLHSEDPGSVANCGEYTFPRGMMVPEFEQLSFDQQDGGIGIAKTTFGYHVIETLAHLPASELSLEDAHDQIAAVLRQQSERAYFADYMDALKAESSIQVYYTPPSADTGDVAVGIEEETEPPAQEQLTETQLCSSGFGVPTDAVIFYYAKASERSQRMQDIVNGLIDQGASFRQVEASSGDTRVLETCFPDVNLSIAPQYVCVRTGDAAIGETTERALETFANECG